MSLRSRAKPCRRKGIKYAANHFALDLMDENALRLGDRRPTLY